MSKEILRELVIAWKDWESIFGREYEGHSLDLKWEHFINWLDINTKPTGRE